MLLQPVRTIASLAAALMLATAGAALVVTAPAEAAGKTAVTADQSTIAAVRAVGEKWRSLYSAEDYASIPELYTTDTLVMPRGRPAISGREAMRRSIGGLAAGRKVDIKLTEKEIHVAGDYAWYVGDFVVRYSRDGQPATENHGRSLILYRRDADGQWRIHRDIDSPAPQPPMAKPASAEAGQGGASKPASLASSYAVWDPATRTTVTACDRMTASRYDRTRLAPPVDRANIDVPRAIAQCEADLKTYPDDPRLLFQLARLTGYAGDQPRTHTLREAAARAGNHNALFLLGYLDWSAAKEDPVALCTAAAKMKLAADRGNYSAQLAFTSLALEVRFTACPDLVGRGELRAYVAAAKPAADGFFENRLADHLAAQLAGGA